MGPGDDCAVVHGAGIAISTDVCVEDVHFRRAWIDPEEVGWRASAAALSDLAAVAAVPIGLLVSMVLPDDVPGDRVMAGVSAAAAHHDATLLGGDVSRSPGPLAIDVVAVGRTGAPVLRSGVQPGDAIWVTGRLGAAAAAVAAWQAGRTPDPMSRAVFARPRARTREARWLAGHGVLHALIDVSDGLAGDAAHLAAASEVKIVLDLDTIPIHPAARSVADSPDSALALALGGGDDYELCLAAPPGACDGLVESFRDEFDLELTRVGWAEAGSGLLGRKARGGEPEPLETAGYSHLG